MKQRLDSELAILKRVSEDLLHAGDLLIWSHDEDGRCRMNRNVQNGILWDGCVVVVSGGLYSYDT